MSLNFSGPEAGDIDPPPRCSSPTENAMSIVRDHDMGFCRGRGQVHESQSFHGNLKTHLCAYGSGWFEHSQFLPSLASLTQHYLLALGPSDGIFSVDVQIRVHGSSIIRIHATLKPPDSVLHAGTQLMMGSFLFFLLSCGDGNLQQSIDGG